MRLIARGWSNKAIAAELVIAEKTVKNHIRRIYQKLDATHRAEAKARWLMLESKARRFAGKPSSSS